MLLTALKTFFSRPRPTLFEQGRAYALSSLRAGVSPETLEAQADNPFDRNEFDDGIVAALRETEPVAQG